MRHITVIGIIGSPRKGMNTDTLVNRVLDGCKDKGASVSKIYLNDLDIQPCQACKVQDGTGCVHQDGMDEIYEVFESADGIVLGTPIYYNTVSSQVKLMIDRSYCLAEPVNVPPDKRNYHEYYGNAAVRFESTVKKKKYGIVVAIGGSGLNPECVLPVIDLWSHEVNLMITDHITVSRAQLGMLPMESDELLNEAFRKGQNLIRKFRDEKKTVHKFRHLR